MKKKIKDTITRYIIPAVILTLMLLSPIGDRLQSIFDKTILPYLDYPSNIYLTILAILFLLLAFWHNCKRLKEKILMSNNWLFALGCTNLIIFLFWIKGSYSYAPLCNHIPFVTYINCFVLINFTYIAVSLFNWIRSERAKFVRKSSVALNPGKPINKDEINEDYEYTEYIDSISPIIIDNFDAQVSVSVGISGAWGSGKTTFLHALQAKINANDWVKNNDRIVIEFKPWFCEKKTDLVQEFFKVYREHMGTRISGFDSDIMEYAKVLTENVDKLKWANQVMKLCTPVESIQKQFDAITDKLKRYTIPVYVIIDDLDRLDGEEIMEILRLIRITANFPFTQFILAYDKPYIQKAIKKQLDYDDSERFIDKVINTEICLPHFDQRAIGDLLCKELEAYCDEVKEIRSDLLDWSPMPGANNSSSFASIITTILPTFRDVHRFINMFKLDFDKLRRAKQEVDFRDFFMLSLIKYGYPGFYRIMALEPENVFNIYEKVIYLWSKSQDAEIKDILSEMSKRFECEVNKYCENDGSDNHLYSLLCLLFPISGEYGPFLKSNTLSLNISLNYNKYFQFKTPVYLLNYINALGSFEDENKQYIIERSTNIRSGELKRVCMHFYSQQLGESSLRNLLSFLESLALVNNKLRSEVLFFVQDFIMNKEIKPDDRITVFEVSLSLPIQWDNYIGELLNENFFEDYIEKYAKAVRELLSKSNSFVLFKSLSSQLAAKLCVFETEEIYEIQCEILRNIVLQGGLGYFEITELIYNYYHLEDVIYVNSDEEDPKFEDRMHPLILDYILAHQEEYINEFIYGPYEDNDYEASLCPLGLNVSCRDLHDNEYKYDILEDSDIIKILSNHANFSNPNYSNALKLWKWIKKTGKDYYEYNDPTKTVEDWIAEGMPGLEND